MPKVAIYVRLSKEDRDKQSKNDDSESIINQQIMLLSYCEKNNWSVYNIYNDEDFSGSDRDRPQFNKMIKDAQSHKFDIVLCKTQSRFARDMEYVEKYINTLFPLWGIRFVGLVDNADSENKSNKKSRQINSMVDQWMLEDLSENIKATLSAKRKQGLWVGAFAPFGYIKDPKNKNHLIIDEDAAQIVRHIFQLYLDGYGTNTLTRKLNEEGIPNPATYKQSKGQPFQCSHGECSHIWKSFSVHRILKNEIYIGNTVQGQAENISYKSTKKRVKPKEEWDIVENTHEPIIDKETFALVQETLSKHRRSTKTGKATIFANKIRCLRCGSSMRSQISGHKRYYTCHTHYAAPTKCEGTYVSFSVLSKVVLEEIHKLYNAYIDDNAVEQGIDLASQNTKQIELLKKQIAVLEGELGKVQNRFKHLYYDKIDGIITADDFTILSEDCKEQEKKVQKQTEQLNQELVTLNERMEHTENVKDVIRQFKDIKEIDRYTIQTLIDYIEVGGNKANRIIQIHWNF
jgi:DNA invertase Pin-like site-specific DNA recombinase